MRSEEEMLAFIVKTAAEDTRIRVVLMNGSRANPDAPRDPFQDFDIVYVVTDMAPFTNNPDWARRFGEMMIMQMPEAMDDPPPSDDGWFAYLMQFSDGNRVDMGICSLEKLDTAIADSQTILLLDKDGIVPPLPPPCDRDYLPKPPTAKQFADCCNEFWWVCPYVAKGLWREEFPYARDMLDGPVRTQLTKMLVWHIGVKTQFLKNPGKAGKYFQHYLDAEAWDQLMKTYADAQADHTWDALLAMCALFHQMAVQVANHFVFVYPDEDERRVLAHLHHVRALPKDAREIY